MIVFIQPMGVNAKIAKSVGKALSKFFSLEVRYLEDIGVPKTRHPHEEVPFPSHHDDAVTVGICNIPLLFGKREVGGLTWVYPESARKFVTMASGSRT